MWHYLLCSGTHHQYLCAIRSYDSIESIKITKLYARAAEVNMVSEIKGSDSDHAVQKYICFSNNQSPQAIYSI